MNKLIIKLIKFYQQLHQDRGSHCRYSPTCSNYGIESYRKFSIPYATFLTIFRILRCNKIFKGGYDPVPPTRIEKLFKHDYKY